MSELIRYCMRIDSKQLNDLNYGVQREKKKKSQQDNKESLITQNSHERVIAESFDILQ